MLGQLLNYQQFLGTSFRPMAIVFSLKEHCKAGCAIRNELLVNPFGKARIAEDFFRSRRNVNSKATVDAILRKSQTYRCTYSSSSVRPICIPSKHDAAVHARPQLDDLGVHHGFVSQSISERLAASTNRSSVIADKFTFIMNDE